ncbi:hypothetical protein DSCOOX_52410 [Desulfosarcina ovata subsp. ovata]|uniref:Uncharacterized protein n=2 Tax=Desulfosarcina ovata TaxID=83564 RepID=A0A5K8AHE8_9BACT|nr:hypothetical protein DSCOOX_52410 [Desulfosarcina ovata subsp. ovata]
MEWLLKLRSYHSLTFVCIILTGLYITKVIRYYPSMVALIMALTGLSIILIQHIKDAENFSFYSTNTLRRFINSLFKSEETNNFVLRGSGGIVLSGRGYYTEMIPDNSTIEDKVEFLLKKYESFNRSIYEISNGIDKTENSIAETKRESKSFIDKMSKTLKDDIASHTVGSYDLNLFGIWATICGVVLQFFCS